MCLSTEGLRATHIIDRTGVVRLFCSNRYNYVTSLSRHGYLPRQSPAAHLFYMYELAAVYL